MPTIAASAAAVDEHALDDHLDVHQAVADDGRRKRERDEASGIADSSIGSDGSTPSAYGNA